MLTWIEIHFQACLVKSKYLIFFSGHFHAHILGMGIFPGLPQPASEMFFEFNDDKPIRVSRERSLGQSTTFFYVRTQVEEDVNYSQQEDGSSENSRDLRNLSSPFFNYTGRQGPQPTPSTSPPLRKSQRTRRRPPPRGPTDHDYAWRNNNEDWN